MLVVPRAVSAGRKLLSIGQPWSGQAHLSLARRIRRVSNAHIIEEPGAVLTAGRRILTDNLEGRRLAVLMHSPFGLWKRSFGPPSDRLGRVFVLLHPYSYNYYHWLIEVLPRLEEYERLRTVGPDSPAVLAPRWLNAWQRRSLELMGIRGSEIVRMSGEHARAEVAWLASHPGFEVSGLPTARSRAIWVRSRLLWAGGAEGLERRRKIFVSRRDALHRARISNEDEVFAALSRRGFEAVTLSELSFDEQIRLFASARVVVAAHGAGLANLLFAETPIVVEMVPEGWMRPEYLVLSRYVGGTHRIVEAEGAKDDRQRMDPAAVEAILSELGE